MSVVLVHGFTGSSASWGEVLERGLARGGRRVVAIDLPGHGPARGGVGRHALTLEGALDVIGSAVAGPMDLVGYSMGGRLALHFAVRHPERVRRLVLESASPGLAAEAERAARRDADEALALRIERGGLLPFLEEWRRLEVLRPGPLRTDAEEARAERVRRSNDPQGLAAALRGLGTGALPSLWDRLGEVGAPTLLLAGLLDARFVAVARGMAPRFPDATTRVVPDAGHTIHLDRPDAWLEAVLEHLGDPAP